MARYFRSYPPEIREQIWAELVENPRVLPIKKNGPFDSSDGSQGWEFPHSRSPVLLSINQESRQFAKRKYTLLFPSCCETNKNLYINRQVDLSFLLPLDRELVDREHWDRAAELDIEEDLSFSFFSEREEEVWSIHWIRPGFKYLTMKFLCQFGDIFRLGLDMSDFSPAGRDILKTDSYLALDIYPMIEALARLHSVKEIVYIEGGNNFFASGKHQKSPTHLLHFPERRMNAVLGDCLKIRIAEDAELARIEEMREDHAVEIDFPGVWMSLRRRRLNELEAAGSTGVGGKSNAAEVSVKVQEIKEVEEGERLSRADLEGIERAKAESQSLDQEKQKTVMSLGRRNALECHEEDAESLPVLHFRVLDNMAIPLWLLAIR
ncbi:hypothetical protein DL98DRAFT_542143 [Cadophora sp. DSE1049]|nr:hypothetical protein DL98DRAFT_542143 [Cadophora sp. DSE1049]